MLSTSFYVTSTFVLIQARDYRATVGGGDAAARRQRHVHASGPGRADWGRAVPANSSHLHQQGVFRFYIRTPAYVSHLGQYGVLCVCR